MWISHNAFLANILSLFVRTLECTKDFMNFFLLCPQTYPILFCSYCFCKRLKWEILAKMWILSCSHPPSSLPLYLNPHSHFSLSVLNRFPILCIIMDFLLQSLRWFLHIYSRNEPAALIFMSLIFKLDTLVPGVCKKKSEAFPFNAWE